MGSKEKLSTTRNNFVDVWRLIAAVLIVIHHSSHLDGISEYPFKSGKIYVEFFYFLTGYFTYAHIMRGKPNGKDIVRYTLRKYSTFWSFTVPYALIVYVVRSRFFEKKGDVAHAILEAFLLIKGENVVQLWFLVALLPMLPLLMIISSKIKTIFMLILSSIVYVFYYFIYQFYPSHFPVFYYRAFAGVSSGVLVYFISSFCVKRIKDRKDAQRLFGALGNAILLLAMLLCLKNILDFRVAVICFGLGLSLLLGCKTDISHMPMGIFAFLGRRVSLPLYVVHLPIADFIAFCSKNKYHFNESIQYCLYFLICGVAVITLTIIADFNKKQVNKFLVL